MSPPNVFHVASLIRMSLMEMPRHVHVPEYRHYYARGKGRDFWPQTKAFCDHVDELSEAAAPDDHSVLPRKRLGSRSGKTPSCNRPAYIDVSNI